MRQKFSAKKYNRANVETPERQLPDDFYGRGLRLPTIISFSFPLRNPINPSALLRTGTEKLN